MRPAKSKPARQSEFFETMSEATRAGKAALAEIRTGRAGWTVSDHPDQFIGDAVVAYQRRDLVCRGSGIPGSCWPAFSAVTVPVRR